MRIVSGQFGGRTLKTVEGPGYRPATAKVRGALFSMLESRGLHWPETTVLDLFAGSGSLGFEALSRGAAQAWFVEKGRGPAQCLRDNAKTLNLGPDRCRVLAADLFSLLKKGPEASGGPQKGFDLIFIDPPYGKDMLLPALALVLDKQWAAPDCLILAEVEAGLDLDPDLADQEGGRLAALTDRNYGQTRIVIWKTAND